MLERALTASERKKAWRRIEGFGLLNGFSFAILGENILVLYALKAGVSEPMAAVLGTFLFLSMPFMLIGKQLLKRVGAARTQGTGWLVRNGFGMLMAAAPFATVLGAAALTPVLIVVGAFGFYASRSMGAIGFRPLIGEVTNDRDRGRLMGRFGLTVNVSYMVALIAFALTMRWRDDVAAFQGLIFAGSLAGLASAGFLMSVPEGPGPAKSAAQPLRDSLRQVFRSSLLKRMLLGQMSCWGAVALVLPVSIVALKRGYGISEFHAILFVLIQIAGGLLVSLAGAVLTDRIGPRPVVGLGAFGMLASALLWTAAPVAFVVFYPLCIFLLLGVSKGAIDLGLTHYIISATDEKDRVGVGMIVMVVGGATAGFVGAVVSGGTLRLLQGAGLSGMRLYQLYFTVASLAVLPMLWLVLRLSPLGDWKIRSVLGLLVSPRDLFTLLVLSKLDSADTPEEERMGVSRLQNLGSALGEEALLRYLDSPDFTVRSQALRALAAIRLSPRGVDALLCELRNGEHTTAYIAADIAGKQRIEEALPELRNALESADVYLRGKAMVALAELGDEASFPRIVEVFRTTRNPRLAIHGALALTVMKDPARIRDLLERATDPALPPLVRTEILQRIAILAGEGPRYYRIHKLFRQAPGEAFQELRDETRERAPDLTRLCSVDAAGRAESITVLAAVAARGGTPCAEAIKSRLQQPLEPGALDADLLLLFLVSLCPKKD